MDGRGGGGKGNGGRIVGGDLGGGGRGRGGRWDEGIWKTGRFWLVMRYDMIVFSNVFISEMDICI